MPAGAGASPPANAASANGKPNERSSGLGELFGLRIDVALDDLQRFTLLGLRFEEEADPTGVELVVPGLFATVVDRSMLALDEPVVGVLDQLAVFVHDVVHHDAGHALDPLRRALDRAALL